MGNADIKVIANAGDVTTGVNSARDIFTPKGGTNLGGMLEAFINTEAGRQLFEKFIASKDK